MCVSELKPGYSDCCHNYFQVNFNHRVTHLRLNMYPGTRTHTHAHTHTRKHTHTHRHTHAGTQTEVYDTYVCPQMEGYPDCGCTASGRETGPLSLPTRMLTWWL